MSKVEGIGEQWQDVRNGLIKEVELIPDDKMGFKPAPESRSVIELLHHIIETQRVHAGEMCRENTNFQRGFPALMAGFAGNTKEATTKEAVLELLRSSLEETKAMVVSFGDANFEQGMTRFDGKQLPSSKCSISSWLTRCITADSSLFMSGCLESSRRLHSSSER